MPQEVDQETADLDLSFKCLMVAIIGNKAFSCLKTTMSQSLNVVEEIVGECPYARKKFIDLLSQFLLAMDFLYIDPW